MTAAPPYKVSHDGIAGKRSYDNNRRRGDVDCSILLYYYDKMTGPFRRRDYEDGRRMNIICLVGTPLFSEESTYR